MCAHCATFGHPSVSCSLKARAQLSKDTLSGSSVQGVVGNVIASVAPDGGLGKGKEVLLDVGASSPGESGVHLGLQSSWNVVQRKGSKGQRNRALSGEVYKGTQGSAGSSGSIQQVSGPSGSSGLFPVEKQHRIGASPNSATIQQQKARPVLAVVPLQLSSEKVGNTRDLVPAAPVPPLEFLSEGSTIGNCPSVVDVAGGVSLTEHAVSAPPIGQAGVLQRGSCSEVVVEPTQQCHLPEVLKPAVSSDSMGPGSNKDSPDQVLGGPAASSGSCEAQKEHRPTILGAEIVSHVLPSAREDGVPSAVLQPRDLPSLTQSYSLPLASEVVVCSREGHSAGKISRSEGLASVELLAQRTGSDGKQQLLGNGAVLSILSDELSSPSSADSNKLARKVRFIDGFVACPHIKPGAPHGKDNRGVVGVAGCRAIQRIRAEAGSTGAHHRAFMKIAVWNVRGLNSPSM